jgi:methionyl-tRNA synthetase
MADYIKGVNWLNYYGEKFSTSRRYGIFTDAALEILPADYWRYFLVANMPESDDVSFTWELFAAQCNKDLADTLGNLVNRVLSFSAKRFGPTVPEGGQPGAAEEALGAQMAQLASEYQEHLQSTQFRKAAQTLRAMWSHANAYLEARAPWTAIKTDRDDAALTLRTAANLIRLFAALSRPIIPHTSTKLDEVFGGEKVAWPTDEEFRSLDSLKPGTAYTVPPVLFRKIADEDVIAWRERFGAPADEH